jgi:hypothetical protein
MTATTATIRLSDPASLIEAVPYLIGFHPQNSLILLGTSPTPERTSRVEVALRIDLPKDDFDVTDFVTLMGPVQRAGASQAIVVMFTDHIDGDPRRDDYWTRLAAAVRTAAEQAGIPVLDVLVTTAALWWSMCCEDEACCPSTGTPRRSDAVAAEAVFSGLTALPKREDMAGPLTRVQHDSRDAEALDAELREAEHRVTTAVLNNRLAAFRKREAAALFKACTPPEAGPLTIKQIARSGVALTDITIRDEVWLAVDEGSINADAFMRRLLAALPSPYEAAPLFLFGWAAWRDGKGVLAAMAAERALQSDPGYSAAHLLLGAVRNGLDPRTTPTLRDAADR